MNNPQSLQQLCLLWNAKFPASQSDFLVHYLYTDTRKVNSTQGGLYAALKGEHFNGHKFVGQAYEQGIRAFLVDEPIILPSDAIVISVQNVLASIQRWASLQRSKHKIPTVGITGSNGKTIVKEWLNQLLANDYCIVRSPKSFNSQIGVPLSVLQMESIHDLGIFEAGISKSGEMDLLRNIIQPTHGIFTFIGNAHAENFSSQLELAREKLKLFKEAKHLVLWDQPLTREAFQLEQIKAKCTWIGFNDNCEFQVLNSIQSGNRCVLAIRYRQKSFSVEIPFTNEIATHNFCLAAAMAIELGLEIEALKEKAPNLHPVHMRMELLKGINGLQLLNDSYSADLPSFELALQHFRNQLNSHSRAVVLSDFIQTGLPDEEWIRRVNELLQRFQINHVYTVGPKFLQHQQLVTTPNNAFETTEELIEFLNSNEIDSKAVLIKGARKFAFEQVVSILQEKHHETVFEANLNALVSNYHYFRSLLKPEVKLMGMVKANGYGIGAVEVSQPLVNAGIDMLAVAYTDEGVQLREAGISIPILVLEPAISDFEPLFKHRLEPEIFSMRSLNEIKKKVAEKNLPYRFKIHLKIDTGMNRLGFKPDDHNELLLALKDLGNIEVASIFTHFAASEDSTHDEFTKKQLADFELRSSEICSVLGYKPLLHAANTGGIQRWKSAQFDMVRLGIGLYGVSAFADEQQKLLPVGELKTTLVQIKKVSAGESVGYGLTYTASADMTVGIIPMGYADGFRRSLSNGVGKVWVNHIPCPVIGRVCMDTTMIDISGTQAQEGDDVIVFGSEHSIQDFATDCNTIAYEILTGIPARVRRVFINET